QRHRPDMNTPPGIRIKEIGPLKVKTIGQATFMDGEMQFWAWSPYNKCSFRCVFCSVEAQGKSKPAITADEIVPFLDAFQAEPKAVQYPFALGSCTDCYPIEE